MELTVTQTLEALAFPPGSVLLILFVGLLLLSRAPHMAKLLLWTGIIGGYLAGNDYVAYHLIKPLEHHAPLSAGDLNASAAQAIVVLAGGYYDDAAEYGHETVGDSTLVRTRYGAYLHEKTGLPVVVSGGNLDNRRFSIGELMAQTLRDEFHVSDVWIEGASRTTGENALFTKSLLADKQIDTVLLVTHAWHMPRSVAIFEKAGLHVIPAPTGFTDKPSPRLRLLIPSAGAFETTRRALHEWVGRLWYLVRY